MPTRSESRSPSSGAALLLGILIPGGGLVYTGNYVEGIITFLGVVGCCLLGIFLMATPAVPLFVGLLLLLAGTLAYWSTARKAYRLGANSNTRVGIPLALVLLIYIPILFNRTWLLRAFKVPTNAMGPTIQGVTSEKAFGDQLMVSRVPYFFSQPKRGDIIVFNTGQIPLIQARSQDNPVYVKRLVGLPGEEIHFENGSVYADGRKLTLEDGIPEIEYGTVNDPRSVMRENTFTVPEDAYFVLGDNSPNSWDSRGWGSVPQEDVLGRAIVIYFPFGRAGRPFFDQKDVADFQRAAREAAEALRKQFRRR